MSVRPRFFGILLLATSPLVFGCGAAPEDPSTENVGTDSESIKGGYADTTDTNVVGIYDKAKGGICTGSLIAPNMILTARHCVAPTLSQVQGGVSCNVTKFGANGKASNFLVTTAQTMQKSKTIHTAVEVLTPPVGSKFCGNDEAILVLSDNVDPSEAVPLVPRVDSPLEAGEEYTAIGYGNINDTNGGSGAGQRRRRDHLFVDCIGEECPGPSVKATEWVGDTGICSGDSGGPAIDLKNRVIGVTSRGPAGCEDPVYGYVFGWAQWIKDTAVYAAGLGGYAAPPWATGWPTDPEYSFTPGDACDGPEACASGRCINDGVASYCTRLCTDLAPCPEGYTCDADGLGVCFQVHPPEPVATKPKSKNDAAETPAETAGCSVAPIANDDPTKPVPWFTGVALAGAAMLRRRARRTLSPAR